MNYRIKSPETEMKAVVQLPSSKSICNRRFYSIVHTYLLFGYKNKDFHTHKKTEGNLFSQTTA